jgi:hypothetical protein
MNRLLKILSIVIIAFCYNKTYAQQETQHSMYFFNPVLLNPAYAGSQEAIQFTGTVRDQWTGLKDKNGFNLSSPIDAILLLDGAT